VAYFIVYVCMLPPLYNTSMRRSLAFFEWWFSDHVLVLIYIIEILLVVGKKIFVQLSTVLYTVAKTRRLS
jgi:hypothetical protein